MIADSGSVNAARCPLRILMFAASLRRKSLNERLVSLVEQIVKRHGADVVRARMRDFDCPSYDGDLESRQGIEAGKSRGGDGLTPSESPAFSRPTERARRLTR